MIVTVPLAGVVVKEPVTTRPADPAVFTLIVASPLKVSEPSVIAVVVPSPLVTVAVERSATVTAESVPVPSTVPFWSVTAGVTAVAVLVCTNLPPYTATPLDPLIEPPVPIFTVPLLTVVGPV